MQIGIATQMWRQPRYIEWNTRLWGVIVIINERKTYGFLLYYGKL